MDLATWITIARDGPTYTVREHRQVFDSMGLDKSKPTSFVGLIGRQFKSRVLRQLVKNAESNPAPGPHGQVCLWKAPTSDFSVESVYLDIELQHASLVTGGVRGGRAPAECEDDIQWFDQYPGPWDERRLGTMLSNRVLSPMCDVVCYFASDFGGLRQLAPLLAKQVLDGPTFDSLVEFHPKLLIVVETASKSFDSKGATDKLYEGIVGCLQSGDGSCVDEESDVRRSIAARFDSIVVYGLCTAEAIDIRYYRLKECLRSMLQEADRERMRCDMRFRPGHCHAIWGRLLKHFCANGPKPFPLIQETRPQGFSVKDVGFHVKELFGLLPAQAWLDHLACPLLSSATIFNNYPPGSHLFPVSQVFHLIRPSLHAALYETFNPSVKAAFCDELLDQLQTHFVNLSLGAEPSSKALHLAELRRLWCWLSKVKTYRTCLCCLMRAPEKVLACGHALCDTCVQAIGHRAPEDKNAFHLRECPLCGAQHGHAPFRMLPSTAGIRLLSIDGGGIRGVIPLIYLKRLEALLAKFHAPVAEYFDFVCGTSAGGLIILGLFMMRWSSTECHQKFEELATLTFHQRSQTSIIQRVQELALAYLRDCQYNSHAIEKSFKNAFGKEVRMFNPLTNATRVAVTTTTAGETDTCLFTNYNGGVRARNSGYKLLRARRAENDVLLSEAACSTSAAPWFFKPKWIKHLGTFQDGALQHNNPLELALWETRFLWPSRPIPDFALTLGTGCLVENQSPKTTSPVQDRFLSRVFRTFLQSMDGEKAWKEVRNGLPESVRDRFHRINIFLDGNKEPEIDDVGAMHALREQATRQFNYHEHLGPVMDSIYASAFYFEFDDLPQWDHNGYDCCGYIFCRLKLPTEGRRMLYRHLSDKQSSFVVAGSPVPCAEHKTKSVPPFKLSVKFRLRSLDDLVRITLKGVTSESTTISGLPKTAREIIYAQGLIAPFGRSNHFLEKPLPRAPSKRKFCAVD